MNSSETDDRKWPSPTYEGDTDPVWMDFHDQIDAALKAQRVKFLAILVATWMLCLAALIVTAYRYRDLDNSYQNQTIITEKLKRELDVSKADVKKLQKATESLLTSTIPGLTPFQYNKNFEINKKYLKRIAFDESTSKSGGNEAYQCRVSLFNQSDATTLPEIVIVFFDRNGFIVDYLHLGNATDSNMKSPALKPNEKRTDISQVIEIADPARKPAYFLANVK